VQYLICGKRERCSLSKLRTLCFDLGINCDDLPSEAPSGKARELILKLGRQRQLERLLSTLAQHPGQTFTRAQLLDRLHGVAYEGFDRSIDAHIKNLRRKLESDPVEPRYVLTVYGVGYKFTDEL